MHVRSNYLTVHVFVSGSMNMVGIHSGTGSATSHLPAAWCPSTSLPYIDSHPFPIHLQVQSSLKEDLYFQCLQKLLCDAPWLLVEILFRSVALHSENLHKFPNIIVICSSTTYLHFPHSTYLWGCCFSPPSCPLYSTMSTKPPVPC